MNILVTGGSGLFGVNWAFSCRHFQNVTLGLHQRKIKIEGVNTKKVNLDSEEDIVNTLRTEKINVVIHAAANTSIEYCEHFPVEAEYINVQLTRNVAAAAQAYGAKFVFISTDQLFSGDKSMVTEEEHGDPVNVYGKTKLRAENHILNICDAPLIVRTNFFGMGTRYRKSFSDSIIESLKGGQKISLFDDIYFTPILLDSLNQAILGLIEGSLSGIFNVVGNERVSKFDFGVKLAEIFNLNIKLIDKSKFLDRRDLVIRPLDMSLSNEKFCRYTGVDVGSLEGQLRKLVVQPYSFESLH